MTGSEAQQSETQTEERFAEVAQAHEGESGNIFVRVGRVAIEAVRHPVATLDRLNGPIGWLVEKVGDWHREHIDSGPLMDIDYDTPEPDSAVPDQE